MGTRTYYTLRQTRRLLGGGQGKMVDGKTLSKWLKEIGIEPQQNPRDRREWRITRTQLEEVARKHRVVLPDDGALSADTEQVQRLSRLTSRVENLEQILDEGAQNSLIHLHESFLALYQEQLERATQKLVSETAQSLREKMTEALEDVLQECLETLTSQIAASGSQEVPPLKSTYYPEPSNEES